MLLVQKVNDSYIKEAFGSNYNDSEENMINVSAVDHDAFKVFPFNFQALAVLSPFFRNLIKSLPCGMKPTIILPDFSVNSVQEFGSLIRNGTTTNPVKTKREASEIVGVAKALDIDASNYTVFVNDASSSRIHLKTHIKVNKDGFNSTSDPDPLRNTEGESTAVMNEPKEMMVVNTPSRYHDETLEELSISGTPVKLELHPELNINGNQSLLQNNAHKEFLEDQTTYFQDYPSANEDGMMLDQSSIMVQESDTQEDLDGEGTLNCQMCQSNDSSHKKLSPLFMHYMRAHFMRKAKIEFRKYSSNKTCKLCNKECTSSNYLLVHIGVKHKKVNELLRMEGYSEHDKRRTLLNQEHINIGNVDDISIELQNNEKEPVSTNENIVDSSTSDLDSSIAWNASGDTDKGMNCQICPKQFPSLSTLYNHYTASHFFKDIQQKFPHMMDLDEFQCRLCDKKMKQKLGLVQHIGTVHKKVNDILIASGLNPLETKK